MCLTGTGYTTVDDMKTVEEKIKETLTLEDIQVSAVAGEHFCNGLKIGILLGRADFRTTTKLASCRLERWGIGPVVEETT